MTPRTISRSAVGGYVKLLRLPFDVALRLRAGNGRNDPSAGAIALDRFEARFRSIAGRTLRDEELIQDAERRRVAADERMRAVRLRAEANWRSDRADERLSKTEEQAEQQRRRASQRSAERNQRAEQRRQAETRRIAELEARRRRESKNAASLKEESIEKRSKRTRLQQLDHEGEALTKAQEALTAKSESQRLRRAATKAKSARKRAT